MSQRRRGTVGRRGTAGCGGHPPGGIGCSGGVEHSRAKHPIRADKQISREAVDFAEEGVIESFELWSWLDR